VLFVLDAGSASSSTIDVTATVTGASAPDGHVTVTIPVAPFPTGIVSRGEAAYASSCASCPHGEGHLAPGLNDDPENVAGDPGWTPQLLGIPQTVKRRATYRSEAY
jgi:mono/diheme cytochrome c family protein